MKARKIVKVYPPKRQVLQAESAAIQQARLQKKWGRFNRLTIADILGGLSEIQLANDNKSRVQEVTSGLLAIIKKARIIKKAQNVLLTLTDAPGIISQSDLRDFNEVRDDLGDPQLHPQNTFSYLRKKLDDQIRAGCLVERGEFYIKLRAGISSIGRLSDRNPFRPRRERKRDRQATLPGGLKVEIPSPSQLQAWFDLPGDPLHAEGPQSS